MSVTDDALRYKRERDALRAQLTSRDAIIVSIRAIVDAQAEDEGLWFIAATAPEAYLQQELRRLHAVIEGKVT